MAWKLVAKLCSMNPWCYALYLENHNYPARKLPLSNFLFLRFASFVKRFCIRYIKDSVKDSVYKMQVSDGNYLSGRE